MLRVIIILIISVCIGSIGFILSAAKIHEENEIREGMVFLKRLTSRFDFLGEEFSVLFTECTKGMSGGVAELFLNSGKRLMNEATDGEKIWMEEVERIQGISYLTQSEIDSLKSLKSIFNVVSKDEQSNIFHLLIAEWEQGEVQKRKELDKSIRLYRTLGLCIAAFFALVFI